MSREAVVELFSRVREDASLRDRLEGARTAAEYAELARLAGCAFTPDELRGVTNAEQFYLRAQRDPAALRRLSSARDEQAVVALAAELGFACRLEDLQAVLRGGVGDELSVDQLDAVSGGGGSFSFPSVNNVPVPPFGSVPIPYPKF